MIEWQCQQLPTHRTAPHPARCKGWRPDSPRRPGRSAPTRRARLDRWRRGGDKSPSNKQQQQTLNRLVGDITESAPGCRKALPVWPPQIDASGRRKSEQQLVAGVGIKSSQVKSSRVGWLQSSRPLRANCVAAAAAAAAHARGHLLLQRLQHACTPPSAP